jgi:hypothetical protein
MIVLNRFISQQQEKLPSCVVFHAATGTYVRRGLKRQIAWIRENNLRCPGDDGVGFFNGKA